MSLSVNSLGLNSASASQYASLFNTIDTDKNGKVSKAEFVAGAKGMSSDQASSLFDSLDTQHTGALSENDFSTAFQQMASSMQAMMIYIQGSNLANGGQQTGLSDLFTKLDTDGDGKVSRDEFVAGRPQDMSADDAGKAFDSLAKAAGTDGSTGLTQDQFAQAIQTQQHQGAGGGHHHHHHHGGGGGGMDALAALTGSDSSDSSDASQVFSALDTNQDGTISAEEWAAAAPSGVSSDQAQSFFNQIAQAAGANSSSGLTQDQLQDGLKSLMQSRQQAYQQQQQAANQQSTMEAVA